MATPRQVALRQSRIMSRALSTTDEPIVRARIRDCLLDCLPFISVLSEEVGPKSG